MIFQLPNPIPRTIKDTDELQQFIKDYRIIPYYGDDESTSHNFLELLRTLTDLSATFKAIARDLREYTFGLNAKFIGNSVPGLDIEPDELSTEEQTEFATFLSDYNVTLQSLMKTVKRADYFLLVSGNAFIRLKRVRVGDTVRYFLSVPHYRHVAYVVSDDPGERFVVVSKFLGDLNKMRKYPPAVLRVSESDEPLRWSTTEPGVEEAIIHVRNPAYADESDYYSRPDILAALPDLYVDYQVPNQQSKISASDFVTAVILAFEAENPDHADDEYENEEPDGSVAGRKLDNFERNMMTLRKLTTNLGNHPAALGPDRTAASIMGIEYPHGGNPPTKIELAINRDTKHQAWQRESAATFLCAVMGWSPELLQIRQSKANIGGNVLADLFKICNVRTVKPRQTFYEDVINNLIRQVCELEGGSDEFKNYGIKFPDVIGTEFKSTPAPVASGVPTSGDPDGVDVTTENDDDDEGDDPIA